MWVDTAIKNKQHKDYSISDLCADDTCNLKKYIMRMKKKTILQKKLSATLKSSTTEKLFIQDSKIATMFITWY